MDARIAIQPPLGTGSLEGKERKGAKLVQVNAVMKADL